MSLDIDIHERLNRIVLRKRWILWSLRNLKHGDYRPNGRHMKLSARLQAAKPIGIYTGKFDADELGDAEGVSGLSPQRPPGSSDL